MIFKQLFEKESSTYTYLIASEKSRLGIIIDPVLEELESYLALINTYQLKLVASIDTHTHADHITASGMLKKRTEAKSMMGRETKAQFLSLTFADNEILDFGDFKLKAIYTPGHTNDCYCLLLDDMLFTGDTLLIGATGRTDFQEGSAELAYDSLFKRILTLPGTTKVFPAHDYKGNLMSTIQKELDTNPRLQVKSKAEYVNMMNGLNLAKPKKIDIAVPANLKNGLVDE